MALPGAVLIVVALLTSESVQKWTAIFGILLIMPAFIYAYVVILWHWKDRYRGKHSDLWGALLLIETSGWFKVVYLFRHLIPDMTRSGRYRLDSTEGSYSTLSPASPQPTESPS